MASASSSSLAFVGLAVGRGVAGASSLVVGRGVGLGVATSPFVGRGVGRGFTGAESPSPVIAMSAQPTKTSLFSYVSQRYERIVCAEAGKDSGILSLYLAILPWSHVSCVLTHAQYLPSVPFSSRQCRYLPGSAQAPQSAAYSLQTSTWEQSFPSTSSQRRRPLWKHCSSASRSARLGGLSGVVTALTRPSLSHRRN